MTPQLNSLVDVVFSLPICTFEGLNDYVYAVARHKGRPWRDVALLRCAIAAWITGNTEETDVPLPRGHKPLTAEDIANAVTKMSWEKVQEERERHEARAAA